MKPTETKQPVKRVHVLRDGLMRRGSNYGTVHAVSIITDGFRLPDDALRKIRDFVQKFADRQE